VLALLATALLSAGPVTLAMPGLSPVNISAAEAELHAENLADDLIVLGVRVHTSRDIATALGVERQRALLGCEAGSCFTELAGALGSDGILLGDVGRIGTEYALNAKVLRPDGSVMALHNARIDKAENVRAALTEAARSIAHQLAFALNRPELDPPGPQPPKVTKPSRRIFALAPAALAVVALGLGAGLQVGASDQFTQLMNAGFDKAARDAYSTGKTFELSGNIALAVGVVAAVAAVVGFFYAGVDE
jgi:hypothetical protein